jgi:hypothetical protein
VKRNGLWAVRSTFPERRGGRGEGGTLLRWLYEIAWVSSLPHPPHLNICRKNSAPNLNNKSHLQGKWKKWKKGPVQYSTACSFKMYGTTKEKKKMTYLLICIKNFI